MSAVVYQESEVSNVAQVIRESEVRCSVGLPGAPAPAIVLEMPSVVL